MGAGLFYRSGARSVYAEPCDDIDAESVDAGFYMQNAIEAFQEDVIDLLSGSWFEQDRWLERDIKIIAANGLFELGLNTDDYGRVHVMVAPRSDLAPNLGALAKARLDSVATGIFDRLSRLYKLRVRRCAWTSVPYTANSTAEAA